MNPSRTLAVARRIVHQFRRDHRSLALLFVVPVVLLSLLRPLLEPPSTPLTLAVVTAGDALGEALLDALGESELTIRPVADEATGLDLLRTEEIDALLVVPPVEPMALATGGTFALELHVRGDDGAESGRLQGALAASLRGVASALNPVRAPQLEIDVRPLYGDGDLDLMDLFAPGILGFFLFFFVFLLTCVSFLRERLNGTMERLLQSPITRIEIVAGYMLGFGLFALIQGLIVLFFTLYVLRVYNAGNLGLVFLVIALVVVSSVNLGIYLSTFARTELQVVQFIPLVITPQALLSGLLFPVESLPPLLRALSAILPLTYATRALRAIMLRGEGFAAIRGDVLALALFALLLVALGALTLRREVA